LITVVGPGRFLGEQPALKTVGVELSRLHGKLDDVAGGEPAVSGSDLADFLRFDPVKVDVVS